VPQYTSSLADGTDRQTDNNIMAIADHTTCSSTIG